MTWKASLRPGSFRGAPFRVEQHESVGGRRLALHEYPLRDRPYPEDLGRKADRFEVEGFIIGAEYMAGRDRLVAALRAAGPGRLVHPWLGTFQVAVDEFRVVETTAKGGMARIRMVFVEDGRNTYPRITANDDGLVGDAAAGAREAAVSQLMGAWLP